jgi:hypothetical protein
MNLYLKKKIKKMSDELKDKLKYVLELPKINHKKVPAVTLKYYIFLYNFIFFKFHYKRNPIFFYFNI